MTIENRIEQHKDRLYRLCVYLEKDKYYAEELFQDTWVRAIEKIDTYNESYTFYPWLSQIAVNLYRDHLRRIKLEIKNILLTDESSPYETIDWNEDLEHSIIKQDEIKKTRVCIARLEDKYRIPLILSVSEGLSYKEIAAILKLSEALVKSRIYDARVKLKKLLVKEGFDER